MQNNSNYERVGRITTTIQCEMEVGNIYIDQAVTPVTPWLFVVSLLIFVVIYSYSHARHTVGATYRLTDTVTPPLPVWWFCSSTVNICSNLLIEAYSSPRRDIPPHSYCHAVTPSLVVFSTTVTITQSLPLHHHPLLLNKIDYHSYTVGRQFATNPTICRILLQVSRRV